MDTVTIAIMTLFIAVVNALVVTLLAVRNKEFSGLVVWAIALWAIAAGTVFLLIRLAELLWISVFFGNLLVFLGVFLPIVGMSQFNNELRSFKVEFGLIGLSAIALLFFVIVVPSFEIRVIIGSIVLLGISIVALKQQWSITELPSTRLVFSVAYMIVGTLNAIRLGFALLGETQDSLFSSNLINNLTFIFTLMGTWLYTYGMVIAPGERRQLQLAHLSERDSLTQLLNRRAFIGQYNQLHDRADSGWAILLFDLDFFKQVNDENGHHVGDLVLKEFSKFLEATKRSSDILARLGGEEFALVCEVKNSNQAKKHADELCLAAEKHFEHLAKKLPTITTSIGYQYSPIKVPLESLLFAADHYLYRAKSLGRNRAFGPVSD